MTAFSNLLVALGAYFIGTLSRLAIIAMLTPFGGYQSSYTEDSLARYISSLTADLPLILSGVVAGTLCGRFTIGRDFGWALVPALMYLLNSATALFGKNSFDMWLIMNGLPSVYTAILCIAVAYWHARRSDGV